MKAFVLMTFACLSACSWFGSKRPVLPDPTEIIVTGAPAGSIILIDGSPAGRETAVNDHAQVLTVGAGAHKVEIQMDEKIVYREETYVALGEHAVVTVLSGSTR